MIASSLREEDGLVDLLLGKGADATVTSNNGQVIALPLLTPLPLSLLPCFHPSQPVLVILSPFFFFLSRRRFFISNDSYCQSPFQTALHLTTSKANIVTAKKLFDHGASARVKDKHGQLPLHRGAAIGSVPLIELLLSKRSPLNATDVSGLSALHHGEFGLLAALFSLPRNWRELGPRGKKGL